MRDNRDEGIHCRDFGKHESESDLLDDKAMMAVELRECRVMAILLHYVKIKNKDKQTIDSQYNNNGRNGSYFTWFGYPNKFRIYNI